MKPLDGRRVKAVQGMGPVIPANAAGWREMTAWLFVGALMTYGGYLGPVMG